MAHTTELEPDRESVAVIGFSCRFPGEALNVAGFWDLCCNGRSAHSDVPADRFNINAFHDSPNGALNTSTTASGHFLKDDIRKWDANFFGVTPDEAMAMDPQQRLMMEVAYEAFENAGLTIKQLSGTNTGCWMGVSSNDWRETLLRDPDAAPMHAWTGLLTEYVSGRVSWFFNLHGPSVNVNTACSSSLVALHQARQSIARGECNMAIVGGANLNFNPEPFMGFSNQNFLSSDGKCKSFDARGDGFGRGEGFGAIVIKSLKHAVRDGDAIRAIIRGTGVSHDGWTSGITLPNSEAQAKLIRSTYAAVGLSMSETRFVEAHGTGTKIGDPVELEAIANTLGSVGGSESRDTILLGSIKSNIGHLEAAAGVAGLIKSILILESGLIPPTIGIEQLNPKIQWEKWRLRVVDKPTLWPFDGLRRISVNSFGATGTIAHVILDEAGSLSHGNTMRNGHSENTARKLFIVSANDKAGVKRQAEGLSQYLRHDRAAVSLPTRSAGTFFADLAFTLGTKRTLMPYRSFAVASSSKELISALENSISQVHRAPTDGIRVGFIFTGQGAQWAGMGKELLAYSIFRNSIENADRYLQSSLGCRWSAMDELFLSPQDAHVKKAEFSQPLCTILQVGLIDLLRSWGIRPAAVAGHSSGEIAAAYCIGALTAEDAWKAAYWRGNLVSRTCLRRGGMLAAGISSSEAWKYISRLSKGMIVVGCVNSPSSVTLSGDETGIDEIQKLLAEAGVFNRRLAVDTAYHSPHMDILADEYSIRVQDIRPKNTDSDCVMYSSVTSKAIEPSELGPANWVRNLVSPVLFAGAVGSMLRSKSADVLLEIGPHAALAAPTKSTMTDIGIEVDYLSVLLRGKDAIETSISAAGDLLARGLDVDVNKVNQGEETATQVLSDLPPYSWNHDQIYWSESRISKQYRLRRHPHYRFIGAPLPTLTADEHVWRGFMRPSEEPWQADHKIHGSIVYPAVGYVAMAIEASRQLAADDRKIRAFHLRDIEFVAAAELDESSATEMIISAKPTSTSDAPWFQFTISSCSDGQTVKKNSTGFGRLEYETNENKPAVAELLEAHKDIRRRFDLAQKACDRPKTLERFYTEMDSVGLGLGPTLQNLSQIRLGDSQSSCILDVVNPASERDGQGLHERPFIIHPATFEPVLQAINAAISGLSRSPIPTAIAELTISADIPYQVGEQMSVFAAVQDHGLQGVLGEAHVLDTPGLRPVMSMIGYKAKLVASRSAATDDDPYRLCGRIIHKPALELLAPSEIPRILDILMEASQQRRGSQESQQARLAQLISLVGHNFPETSVLELHPNCSPKKKLMGSKTDQEQQHIFDYTLATWSDSVDAETAATNNESTMQFQVANGEVDSSTGNEFADRNFDMIVVPEIDAESKHLDVLTKGIVKRLRPRGFACFVGPTKKLEDVLAKAHAVVYVSDHSEDRGLVIAGSQTGWAKQKPAGKIVILEAAQPSEAARSVADSLVESLQRQDYRPSRVRWGDDLPPADTTRCISLVEVTDAHISQLDEPAFHHLKHLLSRIKDILWVTAADDPSSGAVAGMSRSIKNEDAAVKFRLLQFSEAPSRESSQHLAGIIQRVATLNTRDDEFKVDGGIAYVSRIVSDASLSERVAGKNSHRITKAPLGQSCKPKRLDVGELAQLDTLHLVEEPDLNTRLEDDEVEVRVYISGLNFKDVMIAMGRVASTMGGAEAAGVVQQVGNNIVGLRPGDRVVCFAVGMHRSIVRIKDSECRLIPGNMSLAEAASLPLVHCTAYYAFKKVARPEKGQTVLVHAAAGGLGQVAIQYAQHLGIEVFVTVGSPAKRELVKQLYNIPEDHIFHSRDASFAKAIKRVTNGRGVDVVLNSLAGDLSRESWQCLAPGGTFVEVGKSALDNVRPPSERGATYSAFDLEYIMRDEPALSRELFDGAMELVERGITKPVSPCKVFPISEVSEAYRLMQAGRHTGKLLLSWEDEGSIVPMRLCPDAADFSSTLRPDATYMLVGGLGGIGRSLAGILVEMGARHLCFVSRSGASSETSRALLSELKAKGVTAKAYACDVADGEQFAQVVKSAAVEMPPIRGVLQCAMVLRDCTFQNLGYSEWCESVRPKIQGSWNIHSFLPAELDIFILLSSFAGLFGNMGQSNYGAGSTYQDALAHYRRARGLQAVSLDLGIIKDVGVLAETGMTDNLKDWAAFGIGEAELHSLFKNVIQDQVAGTFSIPPQVPTGFASLRDAQVAGVDPPFYLNDPRFSILGQDGLVAGQQSKAAQTFRQRLESAKAATAVQEVESIILEMLVHKVAQCLKLAEAEVDASRSLPSYGINSLVAIEIRNWIFKEIAVDITIFNLISNVPLRKLAEKLVLSVMPAN